MVFFDNETENHYNLRHRTEFRIPFVNSIYHGSESISFLGPKIWDLFPSEFKQIESLNGFEKSMRKWTPTNCPCRFRIFCISGVGFI